MKRQGWGKGIERVSEMSAQLGGSQMPSVVGTLPLASQVWGLGQGGGSVPRGGPCQSTREGSCPGDVLDTCRCLQPTWGSLGFWGGDEFLKHNVLWVEPKKGRCQAPQKHKWGTTATATEEQGGGGSLGFVPVGLSTGQRWAVGPAEQVGPFALSNLGAVLEDKVWGWEEDVGEGTPPGTWIPCPLFVLKSHPPLLWGNASFFPFPSHFCMFLLIIRYANRSEP